MSYEQTPRGVEEWPRVGRTRPPDVNVEFCSHQKHSDLRRCQAAGSQTYKCIWTWNPRTDVPGPDDSLAQTSPYTPDSFFDWCAGDGDDVGQS